MIAKSFRSHHHLSFLDIEASGLEGSKTGFIKFGFATAEGPALEVDSSPSSASTAAVAPLSDAKAKTLSSPGSSLPGLPFHHNLN